MADHNFCMPPSAKKSCVGCEVDYLYFGLRFYWQKTVEESKPSSLVIPLKHICHEDMQKIIREDTSQVMDTFHITGKLTEGEFVLRQSTEDKVVYVYQHGQDVHVACSSVKYSNFFASYISISASVGKISPPYEDPFSVRASKTELLALLPFFYDNEYVLNCYKHYHDTKGCGYNYLEDDISLLEKIARKTENDIDTPFTSSDTPPSMWPENLWTERLVRGVKVVLSDQKVFYTALLGQLWFTRMHKIVFGTETNKRFYFFGGAPDIIIKQKALVVDSSASSADWTTDCSETSTSDEEVYTIENSHQRPGLTGTSPHFIPEKTGEVIADLHMLLVSKLNHRLEKGKDLKKKFKIVGLLLDKMSGGIRCELNLDFQIGRPSTIVVQVSESLHGSLTPEHLCTLLKTLKE